MDPNAALANIRSLIAHVRSNGHFDGYEDDILMDLVTGLDEWIVRGGFLPDEWRVAAG